MRDGFQLSSTIAVAAAALTDTFTSACTAIVSAYSCSSSRFVVAARVHGSAKRTKPTVLLPFRFYTRGLRVRQRRTLSRTLRLVCQDIRAATNLTDGPDWIYN